MTTMIDRQGAVAEAHALVAGYHRAIDSGRASAAISAFADHATFEVRGHVHSGHAEILAFLTAREADTGRHTVHVLANETAEWVDDGDGDVLELRALVLLHVRDASGAYALERVLDSVHRVEQVEGGWHITRRSAAPLHPAVPA